jgi:hypothetical protein
VTFSIFSCFMPIQPAVFQVPRQSRHPERSASQIYRVTQRLMARSRRTPRVLILPVPFGAFQPLKPAAGGPATLFPWGRQQGLLASCYVRRLHLHSRQSYRHALHWRHQNLYLRVMQHKEGTLEGSLRTIAASVCSTLRVTKTFARPSLGKNNSKAGGAKRSSTSLAKSIPSSKTSHRPGDGR